MRFSDIKVKHIYNVIFDDVRPCEFNGKHLALVLKRNNDKQTFIVMPLTSNSNGDGINKIKLDRIESLPSSLNTNATYAVFNQIRTVNASRFIALKEGSTVKQSKIEDEVFEKLLSLGIADLLHNLNQDEKISILKKMYQNECILKAKDLAYKIIKLEKEKNQKDEIERIKLEIRATLKYVDYCLKEKYVDDGIQSLLDDILK